MDGSKIAWGKHDESALSGEPGMAASYSIIRLGN